MTRLTRLVPVLALLAFGCKQPAPANRMGTSVNIAPTGINQVIPATMDPNAANLPGAVGTRVQNAGGGNAWDKGADGVWYQVPSLAATPTTAGLMSASQAASLTNLPAGAFAMPVFVTPLIDVTQTQTVVVPGTTVPGYVFQMTGGRFVNVVTAGTISTSFTYKMGNDGSNVNLLASFTPATTAFSSAPAPGIAVTPIPVGPPSTSIDLATPISLVITGATGTGGFAWKVRLCFYGVLVPDS